ncbi:MAG TPA: type II secretion system protein [Gemmatimonadales bacterium]|nr:type II secretion system protein [Gemmatimonadales bacterium]
MMQSKRGLTLLEVMVALVVLSLVALGYLQLLQGSHRLVSDAHEWSQAVEYAEDAIEGAQLRGPGLLETSGDTLPGGFRREITNQAWQPGLTLVTVTVFLPSSGRFDLNSLTRDRPDSQALAPPPLRRRTQPR